MSLFPAGIGGKPVIGPYIEFFLKFPYQCAYNAHWRCPMNPTYDTEARKRPVNLTLNEDLIVQARVLTDNLSGVVESLLADYVERERQRRIAEARTIEASMAMWNDFNAKHGSFADEYSPL
jgi:antitoxin CcdA